MIRGGHIDLCVLGAFQVSFKGDLANWHAGNSDDIPSVGGAMDLASGAVKTYIFMTLFDKAGNSKLVSECTIPLTAKACVDRIYSDYAVFDVSESGLEIISLHGISADELKNRVGFN
jgi:3-oxoadipate CoA-transferase beta subunit